VAVVLTAAFFASGASALIFETLWFRQAGLAFGNSIWASSVVLSAFMGGLALGNAAAAAMGPRVSYPIRAYALAEAAIAVTGVGLVYLFPVLGAALAPAFRPLLDHPWFLNPLRLLVAFVLLLIPSTAMGITLPLLITALADGTGDARSGVQDTASARSRAANPGPRVSARFGRILGWLYGWNTLGAMAGVVAGEMFLLARFGVRGTAVAAGGLNLVAAAAAASVAWKGVPSRSSSPSHPFRPSHPAPLSRPLVAVFLSGFCLLALEVIWFRFLLLFIKGHSNAFPVMLGVVLAGIALGGLVASLWQRVSTDTSRFAAPLAFLAAMATVVSYRLFPSVIERFGLSSIVAPTAILRLSVPLMLPVSLASGVFFPLVGAALRHDQRSDIESAGLLTLVNTIGAAVGSLAAGFLLLPALGIEKSIFSIALIYGVIGIVLFSPRLIPGIAAAACIASLAVFPFGQLNDRLLTIPVDRWAEGEPERRLIAVREGMTETIVFFQRLLLGKPVSDVMLTNSFSMSTTGYGVRRYQKLYAYWPIAVHPAVRRTLVIGYGVGNTAKALTDSPAVESIDLVDLSPDILSMASIVFPDEREQPLRDPRMHVHIEDGRYFLQTTDRMFDLITGEPPPPGIAGVENLYSREYFQLIRDRLANEGIVTYWLPLADLSTVSAKAILRAFCDVFADCSLWNGSGTNLMVVGTRRSAGRLDIGERPVSEQHFRAQWSTPPIAAELKRLGVERPEQLGALFLGDATFVRSLVADAPPLTDDDPKLIDAPSASPEEWARLVASITDTGAARARFERSTFIARHWPDSLLRTSSPYFDVQHVIDAHMYGAQVKQNLALEDVHRLLTTTTVSTPVLWRLASNADIQQVVSSASAEELMNPLLQYHVGIRLLSERSYAAAAEAFDRATGSPQVRDNAFVLYIYALCMSGQRAKAEEISSDAFAASGVSSLPSIWVWMKDTFGIDPSSPRLSKR
jgi:spermidine synthase